MNDILPAKKDFRYWFSQIVAAMMVLLLLYTALSKFMDHDRFVGAMRHNPLISPFAVFLSWAVPITETAIVLLLFIPQSRSVGLLAGSILMAMFTCYVAFMLLTSSKLPCTCGGILQAMTWRQHLWFNLFFTAISALAATNYPFRRRSHGFYYW